MYRDESGQKLEAEM